MDSAHQSKYEQRQGLVEEEVRLKWEAEQNALKAKLLEVDTFDWSLEEPCSLKLVSHWKYHLARSLLLT